MLPFNHQLEAISNGRVQGGELLHPPAENEAPSQGIRLIKSVISSTKQDGDRCRLWHLYPRLNEAQTSQVGAKTMRKCTMSKALTCSSACVTNVYGAMARPLHLQCSNDHGQARLCTEGGEEPNHEEQAIPAKLFLSSRTQEKVSTKSSTMPLVTEKKSVQLCSASGKPVTIRKLAMKSFILSASSINEMPLVLVSAGKSWPGSLTQCSSPLQRFNMIQLTFAFLITKGRERLYYYLYLYLYIYIYSMTSSCSPAVCILFYQEISRMDCHSCSWSAATFSKVLRTPSRRLNSQQ